MSAPAEIVALNFNGSEWGVVEYQGSIRYVRADLTCGDCAVKLMPTETVEDCRAALKVCHHWYDDENMFPPDDSPACVKIVLRKEL